MTPTVIRLGTKHGKTAVLTTIMDGDYSEIHFQVYEHKPGGRTYLGHSNMSTTEKHGIRTFEAFMEIGEFA